MPFSVSQLFLFEDGFEQIDTFYFLFEYIFSVILGRRGFLLTYDFEITHGLKIKEFSILYLKGSLKLILAL